MKELPKPTRKRENIDLSWKTNFLGVISSHQYKLEISSTNNTISYNYTKMIYINLPLQAICLASPILQTTVICSLEATLLFLFYKRKSVRPWLIK